MLGRRGKWVGVAVGLLAALLGGWMMKGRQAPSRAGSAPVDVEPKRLEAHVRALAETFRPRDHSSVENLDRAAAYIAAELTKAGARVREEPFTVSGRGYRNVVGSYGPEAGPRIVVGAHYDAAGPYPGADDNASGVAGMLELARLLGSRAPAMRVDLVAFSLEEPPYFGSEQMGSAVHAAALKKDGVQVRAMMSLEMIGCFTDVKGSQRLPLPGMERIYPTTGNFIAVVGQPGEEELTRTIKGAMLAATDLGVESINAPRSVPGVDLSDHASFWYHGFPAVMLTDTAFFRNPRYHTEDDTPDTLDYARMAKVVQGVFGAVEALAAAR
ncbi:MAG TPA: M28 family peptidase [Longimicrobium sp.]|nr:M28 family peptidase [Longimicrobium sp.]